MSAPPPVETIRPPQRTNSAPIVHADANSPEQKMAVDSKKIQLQLATDTQFDQVAHYAYESFQDINKPLLLTAVSIFFIGIVCWSRP